MVSIDYQLDLLKPHLQHVHNYDCLLHLWSHIASTQDCIPLWWYPPLIQKNGGRPLMISHTKKPPHHSVITYSAGVPLLSSILSRLLSLVANVFSVFVEGITVANFTNSVTSLPPSPRLDKMLDELTTKFWFEINDKVRSLINLQILRLHFIQQPLLGCLHPFLICSKKQHC